MRSTKLLVPLEVTETVGVSPLPNISEHSSVSYVDFINMKRFNEEVKFTPYLTPVGYSDTIICFKDSTRKKFKSETYYEPRVKPRKFSDTLVVYPKRPQKGYVTYVDYHIDACRKWFKTKMEFKAMTVTSRKMILEGTEEDTKNARDVNDNISRTTSTSSDGPGASQIFLPRWNKDGLEQDNTTSGYPVLSQAIIVNGY